MTPAETEYLIATRRRDAGRTHFTCASGAWAIAYHANSFSARAKRWYHVSRVVYADGMLFELYWHTDRSLRGGNLKELRAYIDTYHHGDIARGLLPGAYKSVHIAGITQLVRS